MNNNGAAQPIDLNYIISIFFLTKYLKEIQGSFQLFCFWRTTKYFSHEHDKYYRFIFESPNIIDPYHPSNFPFLTKKFQAYFNLLAGKFGLHFDRIIILISYIILFVSKSAYIVQ